LGKTIGTGQYFFAGTDEERAADLQLMLDDEETDAILMGRGGYGVSRIIDRLDFSKFKKKPKWICGFSDITVLHNHLQAKFGIQSLHSPMCGHFKPETEHTDFLLSFRNALEGKPLSYTAAASEFNRPGNTEGLLTGGNLSLIAHLTGTASEVDTTGKILFLEDLNEYLYHIDRMMTQLKRAGKFEHLAGIIFGGFTELKDTERPFGQSIRELLWDKVAEYDFPVCFDFPAGHQDINFTLQLGSGHSLAVNEKGSQLQTI